MMPERRKAKRSNRSLPVTIHERGSAAVAATLTGLSRYGAHVTGMTPSRDSEALWLRLPGLASQRALVSWKGEGSVGIAFAYPLHPAVAAHLTAAPHDEDLDAEELRQSEESCEGKPCGSRRDQILAGYAGSASSRRARPLSGVRPVC